jgi:hypothetical protein
LAFEAADGVQEFAANPVTRIPTAKVVDAEPRKGTLIPIAVGRARRNPDT